MRAFHYLWPAFATLIFTAGCGLDGPAPSDTKPTPPTAQAAGNDSAKPSTDTKQADTKHADATRAGRAPHATPDVKLPVAAATSPTPTTTADAHPGETREQAHVGMGEKGRGYGHGYIAVVAASLWAVKERMALDLIKHSMDLYKAEHDGKGPKTHEEFMQKIIKDNDIKLPVLPAGQTYEYDPTTEELMVRMPEDPNGP
jgi:hypothetical protein